MKLTWWFIGFCCGLLAALAAAMITVAVVTW